MSQALRLWHGEDYGFTDSEDFVTIANTCFEGEEPLAASRKGHEGIWVRR